MLGFHQQTLSPGQKQIKVAWKKDFFFHFCLYTIAFLAKSLSKLHELSLSNAIPPSL